MLIKSFFLGAMALALLSSSALAQAVTDRAGELKAWREQCSDPDSDLRVAYIEAALETGDTAVIRICVRQSLESDNADIRNLGLRAALSSLDQIRFGIEAPPLLVNALEDAGDDEDKLRDIERWYIARDWNMLQNGLIFAIRKPDFAGGAAEWYPLANLTTANDNHVGDLTISGDAAVWVGSANLANEQCSLNFRLVAGPALEGEWLCARGEPFAVRADLL